MIKDKLQITIITYNRSKYLRRSLTDFTSENSPIRYFDILIIDNDSTDETKQVVEEFQKSFPNISYIKNNYNVGANANIVKAFEYNTKDYLWIVADDDLYIWENWAEVERAVEAGEKAIIVSRMDLPDEYKDNIGKILHQSAFLSACIFSKSLLNSTVFRNMYDNIYTMFPHLVPLVEHINNQGKFYVVDQQIVKHGVYENKMATDTSWARGIEESKLYRKSKTLSFEGGFCIAISNLKDENLKYRTMELLISTFIWWIEIRDIYKVLDQFSENYSDKKDLSHLLDFYLNMDEKYSRHLRNPILNHFSSNDLLNNLWCRFKKTVF